MKILLLGVSKIKFMPYASFYIDNIGYTKNTKIRLAHSVKEPTYERDIKYLVNDLNSNNYSWKEYECSFAKHGDVAKYFIPIAQDRLKKIIREVK